MNRILSAQLRRLLRDKTFMVCTGIIFILSCAAMINYGINSNVNSQRSLQDYFFNFMPFFTVFHAVFTGLFLGTEHSDGTMRNKIIIGHTRASVFLANIAACCTACVIFTVIMFVGAFIVGLPFFGTFTIGTTQLLISLGITLLANLTLCIFFATITMLCSNKAIASVSAMLLFFTLLIIASFIYNRLLEPELSEGMIYINGAFQIMEPSPNPLYVAGAARTALLWIMDILPTGALVQIADAALASPLRVILCNIGVCACTIAGGIYAFNRKDLK